MPFNDSLAHRSLSPNASKKLDWKLYRWKHLGTRQLSVEELLANWRRRDQCKGIQSIWKIMCRINEKIGIQKQHTVCSFAIPDLRLYCNSTRFQWLLWLTLWKSQGKGSVPCTISKVEWENSIWRIMRTEVLVFNSGIHCPSRARV